MIGRRSGLRNIAAAAAALLLSACWSGPGLFDAKDSDPTAIADGDYALREPGRQVAAESGDLLTVKREPDGSLRVTAGDGERDLRVIAISLSNPADRRFVLQIEKRGNVQGGDADYVLLDARKSPARVTILPCNAEVRAAVEKTGGSVSRDPQSAASCQFRDGATLLAQLRRYSATDISDAEVMELVPVVTITAQEPRR